MSLSKRLYINLWVLLYSVLFFMRKRVTYGQIGNRVEIYARRRKDYHKFGIANPLKVIRL